MGRGERNGVDCLERKPLAGRFSVLRRLREDRKRNAMISERELGNVHRKSAKRLGSQARQDPHPPPPFFRLFEQDASFVKRKTVALGQQFSWRPRFL